MTFLSPCNLPRCHMVRVPFVHLSALLPVPQGPRVGSWAALAFGALTPEAVRREQLEPLVLGIKVSSWAFLLPALSFHIGSKRALMLQQCQHPETLLAALPIPNVPLPAPLSPSPTPSSPALWQRMPHHFLSPPCPLLWSSTFPSQHC